jgi:photosystem II stability/assembly factor-like uncharacterized protein
MTPFAALLLLALPGADVPAAEPLLSALPARNIGPANMGGRIVDVAVVEDNPATMYVAAATGGVWKTTDGGNSWAPVFDGQTTLCIGAVAVAPSNPDVVWVGTGEGNARNSVAWGDGVFRSVDGGKTWQHLGLKETRHIGRIAVHPKNPDVAYVAALGRFWGPNKERGLYKTTDGGKTWNLCKFLDDETGFVDVALAADDPETVYACAYRVRRDAFAGGNPQVQTGDKAGLYVSRDGGKTWDRMAGGLPQRPCGRCGVSVSRKSPDVVYAVVQTDKTNVTVRGQDAKAGGDPDTGGVFRSEDRGKTWTKLNDLCPRPFYYGQIRVDPSDDNRVYVLGINFHLSNDGGKTFTTAGGRGGAHPDHHALWIDPKDSKHLVLGNDGGLYFSKDRAQTWEAVRNLPIGQFYGIAVDMRTPYRVYGGLQDNGSWGGPSATQNSVGVTNRDWGRIGGGDGFQCAVDPTDPDTVYWESQYGNLNRSNLRGLAPGAMSRGIRPRPPQGAPAYRFNWDSPLLISPHDPKTIYYGGNHVFRSLDRGDRWEPLSPDLTRGQPGPNAYNGHTLTTLAESPRKAGLLWAASDDGKVHVSRDCGKSWADLSDKVPGLPPERWVNRIECSAFDDDTAYLAIDRHRQEDLKAHLFRTTDFGATWQPLGEGLPAGAVVHVVRESSKNRDLLFAGTENGLFVSLDGGKGWSRMTNGLPPAVPVYDLVIHPRDRELVVGTHGRSIYVVDVGPLEELTAEARSRAAYLCQPRPATPFWPKEVEKPANKTYVAPNPAYGAALYYHLAKAAEGPAKVTIKGPDGKTVASLTGPKEAGLHGVLWDMKLGENRGLPKGGDYGVTLEVGGQKLTTKLRVNGPERVGLE